MDNIKKAFQKVKQDICLLKQETSFLTSNLIETRMKLIELCEIIKKIDKKNSLLGHSTPRDLILDTSTDRQTNQTDPINLSTDNLHLKVLKPENSHISTGNEGVSTDRQTDTSTDRQTKKTPENKENSFENALDILDSLDDIKKEIRLKIKRLTEQELAVFLTIYQLDGEKSQPNYKILSKKLNLTESSIRDYVGRIIKKGLPVEKNKINNKNILLSVSKNFKKVVTLPTILQLREL